MSTAITGKNCPRPRSKTQKLRNVYHAPSPQKKTSHLPSSPLPPAEIAPKSTPSTGSPVSIGDLSATPAAPLEESRERGAGAGIDIASPCHNCRHTRKRPSVREGESDQRHQHQHQNQQRGAGTATVAVTSSSRGKKHRLPHVGDTTAVKSTILSSNNADN